jgi:arylsulfatase A-like enzyme
MNIVLIMSDTFRRDNLACYGPTLAKTPSLDKLAQQSYIFDNAICGSFPTLPNRIDIMSGRFSFIEYEWGPLPAERIAVQQLLGLSDYTTMMIADNPHLMENGNNYGRGFSGWEWIRGQESDLWYTSPKNPKLPPSTKNRCGIYSPVPNILRNRSWWTCEEDRHAPRTIQTACRWLELNQDLDKFFLYIDLFDPHEPWDAPQHYLDLYEKEYHGAELVYPHYDYWREFLTEEELRHCRALYLAEVTMVDHWIGVLLDKLNELGMDEDTAIIFTSDHGYLFGEHDLTGKSRMVELDDRRTIEAVPMVQDIRAVPLLIHLPEQRTSAHIAGLVQSPDLMPTVLEMAGVLSSQVMEGQTGVQALQCGMFVADTWKFAPRTLHGRSLMPLIRGETERIRDIAVSSNTIIHHTPVFAKSAVVTEDGWCLHYSGKYTESGAKGRLNRNVVPDVQDARIPIAPALYNLQSDPDEERDVIDSNQKLALEIHSRYVQFLESVGAPESHLAGRRQLR